MLLLVLAYLYATGRMSRPACVTLWIVLAFGLAFFAPVWETLSNNAIESSFSDLDSSMVFNGGKNIYEEGYTTGMPLLIGLPALCVAVLTLIGELAVQSVANRAQQTRAVPV